MRLRVLDSGRRVVYEEVLESPSGEVSGMDSALFVLPVVGRQPPKLLIAYGTAVWAYAPRSK